MSSNTTGAFLGGVAGARDRRKTRELEARRLDIVENQFKTTQDQEMLQSVRDQLALYAEEARGIVSASPVGRDDPRFEQALLPIRNAVASLASRGEQRFPGSVSAQSQIAMFDSTITSTPTITETAEAEAEATVAGAAAQAAAINNLDPEQQENVRASLGLLPEFTQEFFGLAQILEDPNATPQEKERAASRLNFINSRSTPSQFSFSADGQGGFTFTEGPPGGIPARQILGAKQLDELRAATDIVVRGRELSGALLESTGTSLGALGSLRSGAQTFTGVLSDLLGIPLEEVKNEFEQLVTNVPHDDPESFSVGEVDAAEGILIFAVARALQGDSNRLLTGSLDRAAKMVKLTGVTSEEQVRDRLGFINQFLASQETNFQRRFEQGTSGTTAIEREPVTPTEASGGATEPSAGERLDALLEALGG